MTGLARRAAHAAAALLWIAAIAGLIALGTWQVHRRAWKLDLIARVDTRLKAPPVPAPATAGPDDAYRRIAATGQFLIGKDSFVQASTERGPGWWVMTPLRTDDGFTVLINRGYVPGRRATPPPTGNVTVIGLLRPSEASWPYLRHNDPATDMWYMRDVAAIAAKRAIGPVAPYFIDAAALPAPAGSPDAPIGGLTVVDFPNTHLVYAITWFTLAAMTMAAFVYWIRLVRRGGTGPE